MDDAERREQATRLRGSLAHLAQGRDVMADCYAERRVEAQLENAESFGDEADIAEAYRNLAIAQGATPGELDR